MTLAFRVESRTSQAGATPRLPLKRGCGGRARGKPTGLSQGGRGETRVEKVVPGLVRAPGAQGSPGRIAGRSSLGPRVQVFLASVES